MSGHHVAIRTPSLETVKEFYDGKLDPGRRGVVAFGMADRYMVAVRRSFMSTDAVRGLYIARWGKPSRNARFQVDGFEVEIIKWSADVSREGVNLYVTIGATARPLAGRDPGHRAEFFTGLLPARDEIASPLAALALYSAREGIALDHGHTVPAGGPLWPGSDMRWFLVLRPVGDIVAPLELLAGVHIDFCKRFPSSSPSWPIRRRMGLRPSWPSGKQSMFRSGIPAVKMIYDTLMARYKATPGSAAEKWRALMIAIGPLVAVDENLPHQLRARAWSR
jgi:hypothetical protein